jgi:hypothetical protein
MISVEFFGHPSSIYTRMIFSFMRRITSLTSQFAWNVSILILTRFIAGQLTIASCLMARKHGLWYGFMIRAEIMCLLMCRNCDIMVTYWWYILIKLETLVWLWTIVFFFRIRPMIFEGRSILRSVNCGIHCADVTPVLMRKRLVQSLIVLFYCIVVLFTIMKCTIFKLWALVCLFCLIKWKWKWH